MKTPEEILEPYVEQMFRHTKIVDRDNAIKAISDFHSQFDWKDCRFEMPEPVMAGKSGYTNDELLIVHFIEYGSLEFACWNGTDWDIPDRGIYPKDAVSHWLYIPNLKP